MSRSYREPVFVCGYGSSYKKFAKREANRVIRRAKDIPNGKIYRKYFDSWNICDCKNRWNPWPWVSCWSGELKVHEPIPEWKARRK